MKPQATVSECVFAVSSVSTMKINQLLQCYLVHFPDEDLSALQAQITAADDLISRKTMNGHLTASGLVLNETGTHTLLIHHNANNLWLQPGGHVDAEDASLEAAALREVVEETGLIDVRLHPWHTAHPIPFDIDTHPIAARPNKGEGVHQHHDVMYLLVASDTAPLTAQVEEISQPRWVPVAEIAEVDGRRLKEVYSKFQSEQLTRSA